MSEIKPPVAPVSSPSKDFPMSRRDFLILAARTAGALGLAGCIRPPPPVAPTATRPATPISDRERAEYTGFITQQVLLMPNPDLVAEVADEVVKKAIRTEGWGEKMPLIPAELDTDPVAQAKKQTLANLDSTVAKMRASQFAPFTKIVQLYDQRVFDPQSGIFTSGGIAIETNSFRGKYAGSVNALSLALVSIKTSPGPDGKHYYEIEFNSDFHDPQDIGLPGRLAFDLNVLHELKHVEYFEFLIEAYRNTYQTEPPDTYLQLLYNDWVEPYAQWAEMQAGLALLTVDPDLASGLFDYQQYKITELIRIRKENKNWLSKDWSGVANNTR